LQGHIGAKDDAMREGNSHEPGREQDPWSQSADLSRPAQPNGSDGTGQHPPPRSSEVSAVGADRWAAPAEGYPPEAAQYPRPPWQRLPLAEQYQPATGPYHPVAAAPRNNPVAVAALVCGIAQLLGGLLLVGNILLAIPALICGAIALREIDQGGGHGRGMAIAGLVLGILGVICFVLIVAVIIVGPHVK
jgi:hypothetical protein